MQSPLLTVQQVAERLNISRFRAYEIIRRGMIERVHIGRQIRVRGQAVDAFIADGGNRYPTLEN